MAVKHTTQVDSATYPDDGTSPVGTTEWNESHTIENNTITDAMVVSHTTTKITTPVTLISGTLPITSGGTGNTTATAATNALLPSQSSNSGKYLTSDGTNTSWGSVSGYSAPTIGSTSIPSGSTVTTIAGLTLSSPTLTTPTLGVATATSINSTTIPTSKTLVVTTDTLAVLASTSSSQLATLISDETGSGALVFANTPTLVTPNIGAATGTSLVLSGDLTINGTTTTINATTLVVADKNIEMGSVATPSNTTANGGGITLKGTTDKTIIWDSTTTSWTSSENLDLASGKALKIAGTSVLSNSTLGSGVTASSLTSVGTISSGTWNGTTIGVANGGTGSTTTTAYAVQCGGTTATGAHQAIAGVGTTGQVLTSNGANALPTFQAASGGAAAVAIFTNTTTTAYNGTSQTAGTAVGTLASGSGNRDIYIKKIDANNEGVFTLIHKNGALVEVQIA